MYFLNSGLSDLIGAVVGLALTLMIFSYIIGDNPLFRFAVSIFIGAAAGYAVVMVWYNVIWPLLVVPLLGGGDRNLINVVIPILLGLLLLLKLSPKYASLGNISVAFMVGVGAAAVIGGAVVGTLLPQVLSTINLFDKNYVLQSESGVWAQLMNSSIILVGVISTFVSFHFSAKYRKENVLKRAPFIEGLAWLGRLFIAITFGTIFAGIYTAALSALVGRLSFIANLLINFLP